MTNVNVRLVRRIAALGVLLATACASAQDSSTGDALRSYLSGNGLLARGMHESAAREYRAFLEASPSHAKATTARYGLAVCLFHMRKHDEAERELTRVVSQSGFEFAADARLLLGQCRVALGKFDAAIAPLEKLLREAPAGELADDAAALMVEAAHRAGKHDVAAKFADAFDERYRSSPLRDRVLLFSAMSRAATKDWRGGAGACREMIHAHAGSPYVESARLLLAQCLERSGELEPAAAAYRELSESADAGVRVEAAIGLAGVLLESRQPEAALEVLSPQKASGAAGRPAVLLLAGRAQCELGRFDEAIASLTKLATADASQADAAAYWIGKCLLRRGDAAGAAKLLRLAIADHADSGLIAELRYDLGVALSRAGDDEAASGAFGEFLSRHARHELVPDALYARALCEHRRKRYGEARQLARRLLSDHAGSGLAPSAAFLDAESAFLGEQYGAACGAFQEFLKAFPDSPKAPQARYRLGSALLKLGRRDEAAPLLEAAARESSDPSLLGGVLALAELEFDRGEFAAAEERFGAYLAGGAAGDVDVALLKRGICRQRLGRHEDALACFDELLSRFAGSDLAPHARFERAQSLAALGRDEPAAAELRGIAADSASRFAPLAAVRLASMALRAGRWDEAAEQADRALLAKDDAIVVEALLVRAEAHMARGRFAESQRDLTQWLERFAARAEAARVRVRLATALSAQDRFADALAALAPAERDGAKLDAAARRALTYEKGRCLAKLGRSDEASVEFRRLLDEPDGAAEGVHAAVELAELEFRAGRFAAALELLARVRGGGSLAPEIAAHVLYRRSACAFELERFAEAAAGFEQLLAEHPNDSLAAGSRYYAGEASFRLGKHSAAVGHFSKVVEAKPGDETYAASLLRLGESLGATGAWARSEETFARYLREFPAGERRYQAEFGVGLARENLGRHDEAIEAYGRVTAAHKGPTAARAQFQIGECLYARKQYGAAIAEFVKVEILYGVAEWSAAALYEAGRCFEEQNKTQEARQQYERVCEKYGQTRWAELSAARLKDARPSGLPGRKE